MFPIIFAFIPLLNPIIPAPSGTAQGGPAPLCNSVVDPATGCFVDPCTTCDLLMITGRILETLIAIAVILAVCLFIYAGWLYLTTTVADKTSKAKRIFWNVFFGLVIVLASFLIVDTFLSVVASGGSRINGILLDSLFCSADAKAIPCSGQGFSANEPPQPPPVNERGCDDIQSGPCAAGNADLVTVFGTEASHASQICSMESHGIPGSFSSTDKTLTGGAPFSVGLFQINMVTSALPEACGGQNCPAAFSHDAACAAAVDRGDAATCNRFPTPNMRSLCLAGNLNGYSFCSTVTNTTLYNSCVAALQSARCNMLAARQIYDAQGWRGGWRFSANQCGIP